jgi:hypothetical protein
MKKELPKFKINFSIFKSPSMKNDKTMRVEIIGPYVRINKNLSASQIAALDGIEEDRNGLNSFIKNEFHKNGLSNDSIAGADLSFNGALVR